MNQRVMAESEDLIDVPIKMNKIYFHVSVRINCIWTIFMQPSFFVENMGRPTRFSLCMTALLDLFQGPDQPGLGQAHKNFSVLEVFCHPQVYLIIPIPYCMSRLYRWCQCVTGVRFLYWPCQNHNLPISAGITDLQITTNSLSNLVHHLTQDICVHDAPCELYQIML